MVVSYPDTDLLSPQQVATRADVAAFVYQALVAQGKLPALAENVEASNYIVGYTPSSVGSNPSPTPTTPNQNANLRVGTDTPISVRYPNAGNQAVDIVVAPGQTLAIALEVEEPIRNANGQILVPVGSTIQGRIVPVNIQGSAITAAKYVADRLTVGDRIYDIRAESSPVAATQNVSSTTLQGALVTAAAESIVGSILGNRDVGSIIGQVLTGADSNTTSQNAVIVVQPSQLDLRVNSDFYVGSTQ
ncbi:MAG: hypothetical protein HC886_04870 [Leptolyngbyaceae cyanobacterium SM1_1_3]|nr:hypothetical protein [Leptolyngbyaceae cyanobacterium SM1_1_3]